MWHKQYLLLPVTPPLSWPLSANCLYPDCLHLTTLSWPYFLWLPCPDPALCWTVFEVLWDRTLPSLLCIMLPSRRIRLRLCWPKYTSSVHLRAPSSKTTTFFKLSRCCRPGDEGLRRNILFTEVTCHWNYTAAQASRQHWKDFLDAACCLSFVCPNLQPPAR